MIDQRSGLEAVGAGVNPRPGELERGAEITRRMMALAPDATNLKQLRRLPKASCCTSTWRTKPKTPGSTAMS